MNWLIENWDSVLALLGTLLAAAAIVCKFTPSPADDKFIAKLLEFFKLVPKDKQANQG